MSIMDTHTWYKPFESCPFMSLVYIYDTVVYADTFCFPKVDNKRQDVFNDLVI